ncbi:MAG: chromosomal replication initiator protein DnaA [Pseudoclavibacter sp.]|nr:chromosomal replication initiator protein DnaA [Pseudoclavibacter sp.]
MADADALWHEVLALLRADETVRPSAHGFFGVARPTGIVNDMILLEVPNELARRTLEASNRNDILRALARVGEHVTNFGVLVNPDMEPEPALAPDPVESLLPAPVPSPPKPDGGIPSDGAGGESKLNPRYTFETFVTGASNRFAHAAAIAVAEAPARSYNPLFIHGDSGLGKTHLLHAIGHYAESMYPGIQVKYSSSEEFTNDFINAIANNRGHEFQGRYRTTDILLIDDIQFLQGRDSTQEAFFHTFNSLYGQNKQIVITSDLHPKQLTGFEDRMRTRFESGLITDVQSPELETRIAILRNKAKRERLEVHDDAVLYIAERATSSIRELEGALIRVTAFAGLNRVPADLALARSVLKDLGSDEESSFISPHDIISTTAQYFGQSVDDLLGASRSAPISQSRHIAMYLCREMTNLSLPKIGELFNGRDHTTVIYANKRITKLIQERRDVYNHVAELTARLRQGANRHA